MLVGGGQGLQAAMPRLCCSCHPCSPVPAHTGGLYPLLPPHTLLRLPQDPPPHVQGGPARKPCRARLSLSPLSPSSQLPPGPGLPPAPRRSGGGEPGVAAGQWGYGGGLGQGGPGGHGAGERCMRMGAEPAGGRPPHTGSRDDAKKSLGWRERGVDPRGLLAGNGVGVPARGGGGGSQPPCGAVATSSSPLAAPRPGTPILPRGGRSPTAPPVPALRRRGLWALSPPRV